MNEKIRVIYEDKNMLAVSKPAGVLVHEALVIKHKAGDDEKIKKVPSFKIYDSETLVHWLLKNRPEVASVGDDPETRPGIVHRLDKGTSGVILIAKNQEYFEYLKNLFQNRKIKKTYLALVYGKLEPKIGVIEKPISLKAGSVKRTIWKGKMEKPAVTEYKVLRYVGSESALTKANKSPYFSLIEVYPKTGRTHQIRIHLASIGHPIVGDSLYGPKTTPLGLNRQFLHAESLEWSSEAGRRVKIECELPEELQAVLKSL